MALVHVTETPRSDWGDPDDIRGWVRLIAQVPSTTMQAAGYTVAKQTVLGYQEISYRTGTLTTKRGAALLLNPNSGSSNEVINVPSGTVWELTIVIPGRNSGVVVRTISVPDITTTISVEECLTPAPGSLPPPGSEIVAHKNQASGYAGLDSSGLIALSQVPAGVEKTANKGAANGYAGLDGSGLISASQLTAVLAKAGGTMTGQLVLANGVSVPLVIPDVGGTYNVLDGTTNAPDISHPQFRIRGASNSSGNFNVFIVVDHNGAPIGWINAAGGMSINDMIRMVDDSGTYGNGIGFEYLNESARKGFALVLGKAGTTGSTFVDGTVTYSRDAFKANYLRINDAGQVVVTPAMAIGAEGSLVPIVISPTAGPGSQPGFSIGLTGDARLYRGAIGSSAGWLSDSLWEFTGTSVQLDAASMKTVKVRAAATANVTSPAGNITLDGVSCTTGDRVLLPYQTGADGGIWIVGTTWTRPTDADTSAKVAAAGVAVDRGSLNGGATFFNRFTAGSTLGVTAQPWYRNLDAKDISTTVAPAINSPGALTSASTGFTDLHLFEQTQAATLRGLAAKIGGASSQGVVVVWEGDSINDGQGATVPGVTRHVDRLNAFSATLFTGKNPGKGFKPVQDAPGVPYAANQWANLGAGVADTTAGLGGNGWKTTANGQTFGDTETFDVMDLVYQAVPSGGATYVVKDEVGTTVATINTTNGGLSRATLQVARITMPTGLVPHAWTIAQSGAGTGKVPGYIPHVGTATKGLLFLNIARGGTDTAYWQTNIQSVTDLITALGTAGSVVAGWIHGTGGNDAIANQASGTNTPSPATVEASLESISNSVAAAAPLIARIILGEYYVSKPSVTKANVGLSNWQTLWLPQFEKAAYNTGAAYIDLFAIFGDASENAATIANGLTMDNGLHFGDFGQQMYANWLWANLVPQPGQIVSPLLIDGSRTATSVTATGALTGSTGSFQGGKGVVDGNSGDGTRFAAYAAAGDAQPAAGFSYSVTFNGGVISLGPGGGTTPIFMSYDSTGPRFSTASEMKAKFHTASGATGAALQTRLVGRTATGAPSSGTWQVGDLCTTTDGHTWVCTSAGTPGTWADTGATGAPVSSVAGRTGAVVITSADLADFNTAVRTNRVDQLVSPTGAMTWSNGALTVGDGTSGDGTTAIFASNIGSPFTGVAITKTVGDTQHVARLINLNGFGQIELGSTGGSTAPGVKIAATANAAATATGAFTFASPVAVAAATTSGQAVALSQLDARSDDIFGDGSDGAGTVSGTTTLTRDMHYTSLSVTGNLVTAGFRVHVRGALTGNGTIKNPGSAAAANVGGNGANAGYYGGGASGGSGSTGAGTGGSALLSNRQMGGNGGAGGLGSGGAGGGAPSGSGIVSAECGTNLANIGFIAPYTLWLGRTQPANAVQQSLAGGSAGGTGGGDGTVAGGGGGGAGGVVCLFVRDASGFTGTIQANGGAGGNAAGTNCGGGGGGGGGFCGLVTYALPTGGYTIQALGAAGGTKTGTGVAGSTGSNGNTLAVALS